MTRSFHIHSIDRRSLLKAGIGTVSSQSPGGTMATRAAVDLHEATIARIGTALAAGEISVQEMASWYRDRIERLDRAGPTVSSILEIDPDLDGVAETLDQTLRRDGPQGPLHGAAILLKDNIATADRMETTAGSLALLGAKAPRDAAVVRRLRKAGALVLGKSNLSEWANFRSFSGTAGWSARGGQCQNPYAPSYSPGGSSSGSAAAVAANFATAALGTETDGSIILPAGTCGIVGLKPTVGLVSRAGVIPIAFSQDSVGPMARTVADVAAILGVLVGVDHRDPGTTSARGRYPRDYMRFLEPDGLRGARIGVPRAGLWGLDSRADSVAEAALSVMSDRGAEIVDPADIPTIWDILNVSAEVRFFEFKFGINTYLAELRDTELSSLDDLIAFNEEQAAVEMPYFGQEKFYEAQARGELSSPAYLDALAYNRRISRELGLDAVLQANQLDALVAPANIPAQPITYSGDPANQRSSTPSALAGYPIITVPAGTSDGLPVGIALIGTAFSEPILLRLAFAFEDATHVRNTLPQVS